jgi:GNAT superfamily N-acetyltransferase
MIRTAITTDIPRIVELGSRWLAESPYSSIIKDIPKQTERFANYVIQNGKVLLYVNDEGKVGGLLAFLVFPHPFTGDMTATELMWYVEPEERAEGGGLRLLWESEKEAKDMGATMMGFTAPTTEVSALYKRFGYKQLEVTFMKEL